MHSTKRWAVTCRVLLMLDLMPFGLRSRSFKACTGRGSNRASRELTVHRPVKICPEHGVSHGRARTRAPSTPPSASTFAPTDPKIPLPKAWPGGKVYILENSQRIVKFVEIPRTYGIRKRF